MVPGPTLATDVDVHVPEDAGEGKNTIISPNLNSCLTRSSVFTGTDMLLCWFGVREMVWNLLRVACSSVGMSPPNARSAGSGRPYQCSDQCHQPSSQTVPSGVSELLSWTVKWPPTDNSVLLQCFKGFVDGHESISFGCIHLFYHPVIFISPASVVSTSFAASSAPEISI